MGTEQNDAEKLPDRISYLLRLWQERSGETIHWRASLQAPSSGGHRLGFAHLDALVVFLQEQIGLAPPPEDSVKGGRTPKTGSTLDEGGSE
jgi:hypothetical protein